MQVVQKVMFNARFFTFYIRVHQLIYLKYNNAEDNVNLL